MQVEKSAIPAISIITSSAKVKLSKFTLPPLGLETVDLYVLREADMDMLYHARPANETSVSEILSSR